MKLLESLMGLVTKTDKPLHVGEVMNLWKILDAFEHGHAMIQGLLNHTADPELKRCMESFLKDFEGVWMTRVKQFMQNHGIPLAPAGTDKPKADEREVPNGAKFTDPEIATFLAAKVVAGTGIVQHALLECLNYDLATMLLELEVAAYRQGFVIREIMERRGWLAVPPLWRATTPSQ